MGGGESFLKIKINSFRRDTNLGEQKMGIEKFRWKCGKWNIEPLWTTTKWKFMPQWVCRCLLLLPSPSLSSTCLWSHTCCFSAQRYMLCLWHAWSGSVSSSLDRISPTYSCLAGIQWASPGREEIHPGQDTCTSLFGVIFNMVATPLPQLSPSPLSPAYEALSPRHNTTH